MNRSQDAARAEFVAVLQEYLDNLGTEPEATAS